MYKMLSFPYDNCIFRADEDKFTLSPMAFVTSDGYIHLLQTYRLTSSCGLDVHAFPFDKQKCNLTMTTICSGNTAKHSCISLNCHDRLILSLHPRTFECRLPIGTPYAHASIFTIHPFPTYVLLASLPDLPPLVKPLHHSRISFPTPNLS